MNIAINLARIFVDPFVLLWNALVLASAGVRRWFKLAAVAVLAVAAFVGLTSLIGLQAAAAVVSWLPFLAPLLGAWWAVGWVARRLDRPGILAWWERLVGRWWRPVWRRWWLYRRGWHGAMISCGLGTVIENARDPLPELRKVRCSVWGDTLWVRDLMSNRVSDWGRESDRLARAFGARSCRVTEDRKGVRLFMEAKDPLKATVEPHPIPKRAEDIDLSKIPIGMTEHGTPWTVGLLESHYLVVGVTGAGKGSVPWSILWHLAPAIKSGMVVASGIDPKGGMELGKAEALFAGGYCDSNVPAMTVMLGDFVAEMNARSKLLKELGQDFVPSLEMPFRVLFIDEASTITNFSQAKVRNAAVAAIELVVNKGRANGFALVILTQDPRKQKVLPFRDEIPDGVIMRVKAKDYVDMVLWPGAWAAGAKCDDLKRFVDAGRGWVEDPDRAEPMAVRASWVDRKRVERLGREFAPPPFTPPKAPARAADSLVAELEAALAAPSAPGSLPMTNGGGMGARAVILAVMVDGVARSPAEVFPLVAVHPSYAGWGKDSVDKRLGELVRDGELVRPGRGVYQREGR